MITIELLIEQISGLQRQDLERWISNDWVRPDRQLDSFIFREIDVARVKLIHQLHDDMDVNDDALPIILSLIDQIYDLRRRLQSVGDAVSEAVPERFQREVLVRLTRPAMSKFL